MATGAHMRRSSLAYESAMGAARRGQGPLPGGLEPSLQRSTHPPSPLAPHPSTSPQAHLGLRARRPEKRST
jgi:hypothetical protein